MNESELLLEARREAAQEHLTGAAQKCLSVLRRNPRNLDALALYGDLAIRLKRFAEAIVIFQKLLVLAPDHWDAHGALATLFYRQGDFPKAKVHAQTALRLNPRMVSPHTVLGSILLVEKQEAEALAEFEAAASLDPADQQVGAAYAGALMMSGNFSKAIPLLSERIAKRPEESQFYVMLASCGRLQEGDPRLPLIRSLVGADGGLRSQFLEPKSRRVPAYMALFKAESDLGNFESAFGYLAAAKAIRKAELPYSPDSNRVRHDKIREVFDAGFMTARTDVGFESDAPIFVVGMPRSGTTLLERVLAGHPAVAAAGELPLVRRIREEACARHGSRQTDLMALKGLPDGVWRQLGEQYVRRALTLVPGARHFVDKMPGNYEDLGFIRTMLPRAKIVHLRRHPVATCLSIYEQDFAAGHAYSNDLQWLGQHYLEYRRLMEYWRSLFGDQLIELDYETLVADQAGTARWLGQRLGLDLDGDGLVNAQSAGKIMTASLWQARQPIHTGSVARWRRYEKQLQPLLEVLAPILDEQDKR